MSIPAPNLYPDFSIIRLSHVELFVSDLAWSRGYYVSTLRLQITYEDVDAIYLRAMEERGQHCVILRKGANGEVSVLGFKVWDEDELDKVEKRFRARDLPTEWIERPFMGRVLRTRDPWGVPLEFYAKMDRLPVITQEYKLYRGAKPLRIDHFILFNSNVDNAVAFYGDMGFRVTEYGPDGCTARAACMILPSPTAQARACAIWRSGCRHRLTS